MVKLPKKGLKIAHLNICSLKNKVHELSSILSDNSLHIIGISETHLDNETEDCEINILGYNIFRNDRNTFGGGVAFYIQEQLPVKLRKDLDILGVEILWLQVHLPYIKPILVGCCYRPPSSNIQYLEKICTILQQVTDENREIYFLGDLNIDWFCGTCTLRKKLNDMATICNLTQMVNIPTRVSCKGAVKTATCIDHIFSNAVDLCSKVVSMPVGFSDHNIIAVARKAKIPKAGPKVIYRISYKTFKDTKFIEDVSKVKWDYLTEITDVEIALSHFVQLFSHICDSHAPIKKQTVRGIKAPWLDRELRHLIEERNQLRTAATVSGNVTDWDAYRSLRNKVTKINRSKKKLYYQSLLEENIDDSKKLWKILKEVMGKNKNGRNCTFIEVGDRFMTKPVDIANHFNNYVVEKVDLLRNHMPGGNVAFSQSLIQQIMNEKKCMFEFASITVHDVEKLLMSLEDHKPCGVDQIENRLLRLSAKTIAKPLCHIFNLSFESCAFPKSWKLAKIIPIPKNPKESLSGLNCRPISILSALSKIIENIAYKQIQHYFVVNGLLSEFQHAYRAGHSTCTALTQLTDSCLRHMDK